MIRRTLRALNIVAVIVLFIMTLSSFLSPAEAFPGDCKDAPVPTMPDTGVSDWFWSGPGQNIPKDPPGGAWSGGAPLYANYGNAGMHWNTYDLGCVTKGSSIMADMTTGFADGEIALSKFFITASTSLNHTANHPDDYVHTFDGVLTAVTNALTQSVYRQWVAVVIALVGFSIMYKARKAQWSHATMSIGWALLVMVIATALFSYPVKAGAVADKTEVAVLGSINGAVNGSTVDDAAGQAAGTLSNAALFQEWKMGTFGRPDSPTANKYAKDIYTSTSLTWAEAKLVRDDPNGAGHDLIDRKEQLFKDTASKIQDEDPDAYEYLIGHHGMTRIGAGFISLIATGFTCPFLFVGSLLMIASYIVIRLVVMCFPVVATVGVAWQMRGAVKSVATIAAAAVINTIMFGIGTAIDLRVVRALLGGTMSPWIGLLLTIVFSIVMWIGLKPARKLTKLASPASMVGDGANAFGTIGHNVKETAFGIGKTAAGAYTGMILAEKGGHNDSGFEPGSDYSKAPRERVETQEAAAPAPQPPVQQQPRELGTAHDRAGAVPAPQALPVGSPAPEHFTEDDAYYAAPEPTTYATEQQRAADASHGPVFMPGAHADATGDEGDLPMAREPQLDAETGDHVYDLFVPEAAEVD